MNFKNQNLLFVSIHNKSLLKNFQESEEKPISTKKLHGFNLQNSILKRKNIAVWSLVNTEENYKIWSSIKKSDRIIFLRDKKFFSKGNVIATVDNINLSKKIWKYIPFISIGLYIVSIKICFSLINDFGIGQELLSIPIEVQLTIMESSCIN